MLILGGGVGVDRRAVFFLKPRYTDVMTLHDCRCYFIDGLIAMRCDDSRRYAVRRDPCRRIAAGAPTPLVRRVLFWLAMPTQGPRVAYDLYKSHGQMTSGNQMLIAGGFAVCR